MDDDTLSELAQIDGLTDVIWARLDDNSRHWSDFEDFGEKPIWARMVAHECAQAVVEYNRKIDRMVADHEARQS